VRASPNLTDLTFNDFVFPIDAAAVLAIAAHCPRLTALNLADNTELDDEAVCAICGRHESGQYTGCPRLRRLELGSTVSAGDCDDNEWKAREQALRTVTGGSIGCLRDERVLPRLEWLGLRGRDAVGSDDTLATVLSGSGSGGRPALTIQASLGYDVHGEAVVVQMSWEPELSHSEPVCTDMQL